MIASASAITPRRGGAITYLNNAHTPPTQTGVSRLQQNGTDTSLTSERGTWNPPVSSIYFDKWD